RDVLGLAGADGQCQVAGPAFLGRALVGRLAPGGGNHREESGEVGIERHGSVSPCPWRSRKPRNGTRVPPVRSIPDIAPPTRLGYTGPVDTAVLLPRAAPAGPPFRRSPMTDLSHPPAPAVDATEVPDNHGANLYR